MRTPALTFAALLALSACAQSPASITPNVVPAAQFASLTCEQMAVEASRITAQLGQYVPAQQRERDNDNGIVTASVIFLPIAGLFAMGGPNYGPQIAQLRGEAVALEQAAGLKGCAVRRSS